MQFVEPLLGEGEGALGAEDFEVMLHLATGGDPVALDRAGRAVLEAQERAADVIDLDATGAAFAVRTFADHRHAIAHDAGDRPRCRCQQELRRGQCMAADVGQCSAAGRVVAEGEGSVGSAI